MAIRGWVYVITNKSMPSLVKIGFSTKDPHLRAEELGTGSPHSYQVEYDALVEDPQSVEQSLHQKLSERREGKEWFRCSIREAVNEIREIVRGRLIAEKLWTPLVGDSPKVNNSPNHAPHHVQNRAYSIVRLKEEMEKVARELRDKKEDPDT